MDHSCVRTMRLLVLVYQLTLILHAMAQNGWEICTVHPTFRKPANSDITVVCGTVEVELQILLCPVYFGGYNESLVVFNGCFDKANCKGTPDLTADPPVLKFKFSMSDNSLSECSHKVTITEETGTGMFSDYSKVQYVNISGVLNSFDPSGATIVYRQELMYLYSCRYPLQYLTNKTETSVSGVNLVIKDNNGSFVSTLSMRLFQDSFYTFPLRVPDSGLTLKTRIFVEVRATNLTQRFNVLLDRCYATTSPFPLNSTYYDLFVGCDRDIQTVMGINGDSQNARFSFEAFRFVQDNNKTMSTYYVHCATRLCEHSFCTSLKRNCSGSLRRWRRRRETTSVSDTATVSSGPIVTNVNNGGSGEYAGDAGSDNRTVLGVALAAVLMGVFCITTIAALFYKIHYSKTAATEKTILHH